MAFHVEGGAVDIRPAALDDAEQIAKVHVLGWQIGYRGLLPQPVLDRLTTADHIARWTATVQQAAWPAQGILVAADHEHVLGFANIRPTRNEDQDPAQVGEIASLYVDPDAWDRGIGRQLVAAAKERLTDAGRTSATLWVLDTNTQAIAFYNAIGWSPDGGIRPDIVGGMTIHDLRYRCPLHPEGSG